MDVRWYPTVVLMCIFLTVIDVESLFIYLLAIFISSLEICMFMTEIKNIVPFRLASKLWNSYKSNSVQGLFEENVKHSNKWMKEVLNK